MTITDQEAVDALIAEARQLTGAGFGLCRTQAIDLLDALTAERAKVAALEAEVERLRGALADTVNHLDGFVALESRRKVGSHWFSEGRTFPTSGQCAAGRECAQRARQALGDTHD